MEAAMFPVAGVAEALGRTVAAAALGLVPTAG